MKKLLFLVALVGIGAAGYFFFVTDPPPVKAYKNLVEAMARGQNDVARGMSSLDDATFSKWASEFRGLGSVPMQSMSGLHVDVKSVSKSADGGEATIEAVVIVFFNPPGVESAMAGAMAASYSQTVKVRNLGAGWKVASLDGQLLTVKDTRHPDR